jgi:hypothetical protein
MLCEIHQQLQQEFDVKRIFVGEIVILIIQWHLIIDGALVKDSLKQGSANYGPRAKNRFYFSKFLKMSKWDNIS